MASLKDRLLKQKEEIKRKSSGGNFFTVKEGTTRMRPVPVGSETDFAVEIVYFFLGKDIGGVISPATFGKICPIMKHHTKLMASKDPDDRDFAKKFKPSKKWAVAHYKYKDEKGKEVDYEAGVKLALLTPGIYNDLIDYWLDEEEAGDFTDPKAGYDLKYGRTGKTLTDTEYTVRACKPTPCDKKFKGPYDPIKMVKEAMLSKEELQSVLEKFLNVPADDEDESPKKKKSSKESSSKKKKRRTDV